MRFNRLVRIVIIDIIVNIPAYSTALYNTIHCTLYSVQCKVYIRRMSYVTSHVFNTFTVNYVTQPVVSSRALAITSL